jgi:DNA-binding CsgD family transcriptional regulator/tetratricopeptide (TPR) repeat protein
MEAMRGSVDAGSGGVARLFGRRRERAQLRELLASAVAGRGRLALVSGEAGIGKTTLIEDLARAAAARDCLVLVGRCYDLTTTPPYGPWLEIMRDSPHVDGLPSLSAIFAGDVGDAGVGARRREDLFDWAFQLLSALAARQPLLLVLDDLHWADQASLDALRHIGRALAPLPVLLVAAYRDDELTRRHPLSTLLPLLVRESAAERVVLRSLEDDTIRSWVAGEYALADDDERCLVDCLGRYSDGNPFFISELLRTLEDDRILVRGETRDRLGDLTEITVPQLLRQVTERRLDHVREETRELLSIAAVIGQRVPLDLWRQVSGAEDGAIEQAIGEALGALLLTSDARQSALRFRHALIREALYQDIVPPRRQVWHRRVAENLLATSAPDPDEVAHHLRLAADPRAVAWLTKAGDRAYHAAFALDTAAARYEAALDLIGTRHESLRERGWLLVRLALVRRFGDTRPNLLLLNDAADIAAQTGDRALEAVVRWNRGMIRIYAGDNGLADVEAGHQALAALDERERRRLQQEVPSRTNDLLYQQAVMVGWYATFGRYAEALALAERATATLPEQGGRSPYEANVHAGRASALAALGRVDEARSAFDLAHRIFAEHGFDLHAHSQLAFKLYELILPYFADDLEERQRLLGVLQRYANSGLRQIMSRGYRVAFSPLDLIDGRWSELEAAMAEQTEEEYRAFFTLYYGVLPYATYCRYVGRSTQARALLRRLLPSGHATDFRVAGWHVRGVEGLRLAADLALDENDLATAAVCIDAHDYWMGWSGRVEGRAQGALLRARHLLARDERAAARREAEEALAHAGDPRQPLALLAARRFLGTLDTLDRRYEVADQHLCAALDLATACAAPYERALTLLARARLYLATGRAVAAGQALDEVVTICQPLGAQPALAEAREMRRTLDEPQQAGSLSNRELDVLALVAEGLTDREVAVRLYISPRTVNQHLRSIYNKLGVSSRTAATRLAMEQGLLKG